MNMFQSLADMPFGGYAPAPTMAPPTNNTAYVSRNSGSGIRNRNRFVSTDQESSTSYVAPNTHSRDAQQRTSEILPLKGTI